MNILIELLLKSVFARPNERVTRNRAGLPPGKTSGLCYNYYSNDTYKNDPLVHRFLRAKVAKDISLSEAHRFSDALEDETIPKLVSARALSWSDEGSLYDVVKKEEAQFVEETFLRLKNDFKRNKYYTFPLNRFSGREFKGSSFSVLNTESLDQEAQYRILQVPYYSKIDRWLQISARSTERAGERMEAICGAFSLALNDAERHQFSMAAPVSGHLDQEGCLHSFPTRVVPPVSTGFEISEADANWLKDLDKKFINERINAKELQALRFFFFAWFSVSQERFALNCMALDALVPSKFSSMRGKCEWIKRSASVDVDLYSLELLFKKIRSSIIHGSSASLPLCPEYPTFVYAYRVEALSALDALTADLLKGRAFTSRIGARTSPIEKDPEIKAAAERIFGAENLARISCRPGLLRSLSKGHLSTWEIARPSPGIVKRIRDYFKR